MSGAGRTGQQPEKRAVLYAIAAAVLLIVCVAVFAPEEKEDDPRPSTYNAGAAGAKALYQLLPVLGYRVDRTEAPLDQLNDLDALHTTLVLANPLGESTRGERDALSAFLKRGGRLLADGDYGADIAPGYFWQNDARRSADNCLTTPEGTSELAQAGPVHMEPTILADDNLPEVQVAQRCPEGAAVIFYPWGDGTVVWWTSAQPLTNRGLHDDANLKLLLASIGPQDRTVLFYEGNREFGVPSPWASTKGIPITAMVLQLLFAGCFLVLAFGRRHGPVRTLNTTPRTSPLEFAYSMGNLYHRAGAGEAAVVEARARLVLVLERRCGLSRDLSQSSGKAIADALQERFGYANTAVADLLDTTATHSNETEHLSPSRALTLVQSLDRVADDLRQISGRTQERTTPEKSLV